MPSKLTHYINSAKNSSVWLLIVGGFTAVLGLFTLLGWHLSHVVILRLFPDFVFMQYSIAWAFFLCGAALILLTFGWSRIAWCCGIVVFSFGLATLFEYIWGFNLGIDDFFVRNFLTTKVSYQNHTVTETALSNLCFVLSGASLIMMADSLLSKHRPLILSHMGSIIVALSILAFFGYLSGISAIANEKRLTLMTVHVATGFIALGIGINIFAWHDNKSHKRGIPQWLPFPVGICLLTASLCLWQEIVVQERLHAKPSFLPAAVLMVGFLTSSLVALVIYVAQTARSRAKEMELINRELAKQIAERHLAEEKLKASKLELERSNRELEDFASVASHDLQEPLRKIQAFGDRLKAICQENLNDEARDCLERMQDAAKRMQNFINELLTFSQVSTQAQTFLLTDLTKITQEVLADLEVRIEQTGGQIKLESLPSIDADPMQMRQLIQNLISNALKFHHKGEAPVIKIYSKLLKGKNLPLPANLSANGFCQFIVEDNGIGFDEKHLDRIFTVFQRLHGRSEYEGTGIGLATCRKIAERHGGSITAKSVAGQGATFIVTLPTKQPKQKS